MSVAISVVEGTSIVNIYTNYHGSGWILNATTCVGAVGIPTNIQMETTLVGTWQGFFDNITFNSFEFDTVPVNENATTHPTSPEYNDTISFSVNTSTQGWETTEVIFCLYYPNGSQVFCGNGTQNDNNWTSSDTYTPYGPGVFGTYTWTINVTAGNGATTNETNDFNINFPTPTISGSTSPGSPGYHTTVTFLGESNYDELGWHYFNFTLAYPNGTVVSYLDHINGTSSNSTYTCPVTFVVANHSVTYRWWINATNFNGTNLSATYSMVIPYASDKDLFGCNSTTIGNTICSGRNNMYELTCRQLNVDYFFWDYESMTYCQYGCFNGTCADPEGKTCKDKCVLGATVCSADKSYVYTCFNRTATSCLDWSAANQTYCRYGCQSGICANMTSECALGNSLCAYDRIYYCGDYNGDGFYEYNERNSTLCTYGCIEKYNSTTQRLNATCNYHSFGDVYDIQNAMATGAMWTGYILDSPNIKRFGSLAGILFLLFFVNFMFGRKDDIANGKLSSIILFASAGFFGMIGWLDIPLIILFFVIGGSLYVKDIYDDSS